MNTAEAWMLIVLAMKAPGYAKAAGLSLERLRPLGKLFQNQRKGLDAEKVRRYSDIMIIETIRKEIKTCGKSRYKISMESGVDQAVLCKVMQGGDLKTPTADILLDYFGFEIRRKKTKKSR